MRFFILLPILLAFVLLEIFIGGARLLYAVPGVSLVALAAVLSILPGCKTSNRTDIPSLIAALAFAAYILVRNRFSEVEYIARLQFFIMAGCLMIYLIASLVLTRPLDRKWLFGLLILLALVQMVPAIVQFTQADSWMPLSWAQRRDHSWRASGFFISPNNFAGFLEISALMATSFTIWGRASVTTRVLTGYIALACVAGVAMSGSRGGYMSMLTGSVVLLTLTLIAWHHLKRDHFVLAAIISTAAALLLFAGILLTAFLSPHVGERVMEINDPGNMRLLLWHSALQQFQLSPIWGTGGFSFLYYGRLFRDPSVQNDPIHVHDDYLQLLADYGLVGALLFLVFLYFHLRAGIGSFLRLSTPTISRSVDLQSDRLALNIGALASVAAYMVHSVVDFNMQLPLNALMMAAILAVLANQGAPREEPLSGNASDVFLKFLRYALPLLGLGTLIYGIPMIRGEYFAERARIALRDGNAAESLKWAREGTIKSHDNPELYFYRGEAAMQVADEHKTSPLATGLQLESIDSFASGLKVFPYDSRLALKLAQAKAVAGDYFGAIDSVNYAEKLDPNSAFVEMYHGVIEYSFGYYEDARAAFDNAIALGGDAGDIAQKGMKLVDKAEDEENNPSDSDDATASDQTPAPEQKPEATDTPSTDESAPSTDQEKSTSPSESTESSSDLTNAIPSATPHASEVPH